MDGTDPVTNYQAIRDELLQYDAPLAERPEVIAVTKCELPGAEDVREELKAASGHDVHLISAVTGKGLRELLHEVVSLLAVAESK